MVLVSMCGILAVLRSRFHACTDCDPIPSIIRMILLAFHGFYFLLGVSSMRGVLSGGELFDRIVSKTFYNEKEARDLVRTLLRTVKHLHDQNIIHRDLKVCMPVQCRLCFKRMYNLAFGTCAIIATSARTHPASYWRQNCTSYHHRKHCRRARGERYGIEHNA